LLSDYRSYGYGRKLVEALHLHVENAVDGDAMSDIVEERDGKRLVNISLHSQIYVIPFYAKLGYVAEGPEFDEEGAPHRKMVKELELRTSYYNLPGAVISHEGT